MISLLFLAGLVGILAILIATQAPGPIPAAGTPGVGAMADEPILSQAAGPLEPAMTVSCNHKPVSISGGGSIQLIK